MFIPDLETRKRHTKQIIKNYGLFLEKITKNKTLKIYITYLIHILIVIFPLFIIVFKRIDLYFYISVILWILIMCFHFYFNGCIFIRIERELMEDKTWKGIWTPLFYILNIFNVETTSNLANSIFICWGILLTMFIFLKLLFQYEPSILYFFIILLPKVLFQKNINILPT
jgi:hypothetical protein